MYHDLKDMAKQIEKIKKETIRLREMAGDIQCVDRNIERIMASIKMLEINISDLVDV
jgi:branched-subunit amino acid aminotransferase/4-amino-4-deoxychorismate lyase